MMTNRRVESHGQGWGMVTQIGWSGKTEWGAEPLGCREMPLPVCGSRFQAEEEESAKA